jgi:mono/diheme cytochrome c family protein
VQYHRRMPFRTLAVLLIAGCAAFAAGCGHGASSTAAPTATPIGNSSRGAGLFRADCAVCHTANGAAAGVGPPLTNEKAHKNFEQTIESIKNPDPPMPKLYPSPLSERDVEDLAAYVQTL